MPVKTVAVVIPLYNGALFIRDSLESVLQQSRPADEIIVVDDGSSDDGPDVVRSMQATASQKITLLTKPNGGQSSARNHGIRNSTSDLIALLDQDDVWYPRHLESLCSSFENDTTDRLGWSYSNLDQIDRNGQMMRQGLLDFLRGPHPKRDIYHLVDRNLYVLPSAAVFSRTAFETVGGFDERLIGYEDDDFYFRIFRNGYDNAFLNERLSAWRVYPGSTSGTKRMIDSAFVYSQKLIDAFADKQQYPRIAALVAQRFMRIFASEAYRSLRAGNKKDYGSALKRLRTLWRSLGSARKVAMVPFLVLGGSYHLARMLYVLGPLQLVAKAAFVVSRRGS